MTVTAAAPQSADSARSEPSPRVAPPMAIVPPKSAETARAEAAPPVASEAQDSTNVAVAAPEATEHAGPAPKKAKKTARKAPRHERRDPWNPLNFFAWGGNNGGWRRSF
jgi:hypothetical protein